MRPSRPPRVRQRWHLLAYLILVGLVTAGSGSARADGAEILRVRYFSAPDHTRVVLDLSGPAEFSVRRATGPDRLAVNILGASFRSVAAAEVGDGLVRRVRCHEGRTRAQAVLDLAYAARHESFVLPAAAGRPDRIVIDVFRSGEDARRREPVLPSPPVLPVPSDARPFRVVIDPGHGGLDPGAVRAGVQEKDVVLAVCQQMKRLLDELPGYEAVLTRSRDYYPSLTRRVEIAREQKGDLFLSIHCNTHRRTSLSGMEVYFLSLEGATDREAQELADKENAADLVGLAPGEDRGDAVMSILMDLHMTRVLEQSGRLAESVLAATGGAGLATRRVKQARFQVLRTLAMPAALVELAYLSHPDDRRLLTSSAGQRRLAAAVVAGIVAYRRDDTTLAAIAPGAVWSQRYEVRRGDSLWSLARRHGTTVAEIAQHNQLTSPELRIGQSLRLPTGRSTP